MCFISSDDEFLTSSDLDNYYTKTEADDEFLSSLQIINISNDDSVELGDRIAYVGGTITGLAISVPSILEIPFNCQMYFTVGENDLTITYTDTQNVLRFSGDDCKNNLFTPNRNKRYSLNFNYDGMYLNVYVQATSPNGFFSQGYVKSDGTMSIPTDVDHDKYVTTDFIDGGQNILIQLNEYFYVNHIALYNVNENTSVAVNYDLLDSKGPRRFHNLTEYSISLPSCYKIRLCIVKNETVVPSWDSAMEGSAIGVAAPEQPVSPDDDIVKKFLTFTEKTYTRMPSDDPHYEDALLRAQHLHNISHIENGKEYLGINYSDQNEVPRLGLDVSPYTFATCWANPRGVQNTENVHTPATGGHSEYGYVYTNAYTGDSSIFYGTSCSNSVDFILGRSRLNVTGEYRPGGRAGVYEITLDEQCSKIKPLDIVVRVGHVFIVMAVY